MTRLINTVLSAVLLLASFGLLASPQKTGDFALIDQVGEFHQLSRYKDHKAFVVLSYSASCKTDKASIAAYRKVVNDFADQPVAFFLLNAESVDREAMASFTRKNKIDVPILIDDTQLLTQTLGLQTSAEVAVIDPNSQAIIYRGPINNQLQAVDAAKQPQHQYLVEVLQGKTADNPGNGLAAKGCDTSTTVANANISFNQDVAPILEQRCIACHREGGIGPFAMNSYAMVRGWAPMIREVVMSKRMPPGQIDPRYKHLYQDVAHLSIEEQQTLVNWIDAGAGNSDKRDVLADLKLDPPEWQLGQPDIIVDVPAQAITATGVVDYRYEKIPLNLDKDIWVKAVEFLPSAHDVMHHIIAFSLDTPDFSELQLLTQGVGLGAYAPGNQPTVFPEDTGYKLSAGGGLFLQLHYTTSGKAAVDNTRIGLYLLDEPPPIAMRGGSAAEFNLSIPPNTKESPMTADRTFDQDIYLVSLSPHMHFRGKKIKYTLIYPDGKEEVILSVPNYQFNWQKNYDFVEPMFVPAGTRMVVDGAFDNSTMNPNNPDPSVTVTWGEQSWNEMFFGFYRYRDAEGKTLAAKNR